jgi:lysophospholipase L1-like esterase
MSTRKAMALATLPRTAAERTSPTAQRRLRGLGLIVSAIAAVALMVAPSAANVAAGPAAQAAGLSPGDKYVALGSSYASGPGLATLYDLGCLRSTVNYAHQVAAQLQLVLVDVTCSLATTANITTTSQTAGGVVRPPQIEAVTPDTDLVTVTVGGNDVDYASSLIKYGCDDTTDVPPAGAWTFFCMFLPEPNRAAMLQKLDALPQSLRDMLARIRERAPEARILLVTYERVIPPEGKTCPAIALSPEHASFEQKVGWGLQRAFRQARRGSDAELLDLYRPSTPHTPCAGIDPWISGWEWGPFPTGTIAFHPTPSGMTAAARRIVHRLD